MPVVDEDDDAVIVPAPAPSVFASPRSVPGTRRVRSLFFRRTIIPILLTTGVTLGSVGGLWFTLDPDDPLRVGGSGVWLPMTFFGMGAVMLVLAVLNMLQVRHLMRTTESSSGAAVPLR